MQMRRILSSLSFRLHFFLYLCSIRVITLKHNNEELRNTNGCYLVTQFSSNPTNRFILSEPSFLAKATHFLRSRRLLHFFNGTIKNTFHWWRKEAQKQAKSCLSKAKDLTPLVTLLKGITFYWIFISHIIFEILMFFQMQRFKQTINSLISPEFKNKSKKNTFIPTCF